MTSLKFETSNGLEISNPSLDQIDSALGDLQGDTDSFAILSRGDEVYVQVAGSPEEGFVLECRDGSEESHFQAKGDHLPLSVVQDIFHRYAAGDATWRSKVLWEPWMTGNSSGSSFPALPVALAIAVILAIAGLVAWLIQAA